MIRWIHYPVLKNAKKHLDFNASLTQNFHYTLIFWGDSFNGPTRQ
jgi:hypothetical protein